MKCSACNGFGWVHNGNQCIICQGKGVIEDTPPEPPKKSCSNCGWESKYVNGCSNADTPVFQLSDKHLNNFHCSEHKFKEDENT